MKPLLTIAFLCLLNSGKAQTGITFCLKGYESSLEPCCENIIGDTILYCNGKWNPKKKDYDYYPSTYRIVKYDYGNPPPPGTTIMNWILNGLPAQYKEWSVSSKEIMRLDGDDPILLLQVQFYCPNHKSLLPKYCYDVTMGMDQISVHQNSDTTNKYMKIKYPTP